MHRATGGHNCVRMLPRRHRAHVASRGQSCSIRVRPDPAGPSGTGFRPGPNARMAARALPWMVQIDILIVSQSFAERPKRYGFTKLINPENMNIFNILTFSYRLALAPLIPSYVSEGLGLDRSWEKCRFCSGSGQQHALNTDPRVYSRSVFLSRMTPETASPFGYPLRCVTLLLRTILILFQDTVDNTDERIELRADRRPRPDITRWRRIAQHLPDRARVDPKTTSRFALAQTLNHYRVANPPIQFHSLHPPPFAPKCKGLSLTEFCSGATRLSGRFSEGLLLRRSQRIHGTFTSPEFRYRVHESRMVLL